MRKKDHQNNFEMLYGLHPVRQAIQHQKRKFQNIFLGNIKGASPRLNEIQELARKFGISIQESNNELLDKLTGRSSHQSVVLQCTPLPNWNWNSLKNETRKTIDVIAVLDQVEDPQNLGAIIRSCGFFKIKALVLSKDHSCPITPTVSKVSAGVAEWFPVIRETNISRFLENKKKEGYWVVGLDGHAQEVIENLKVDQPYILVLGNEGQGLRPLVRKSCDWLIRIGGEPSVDSLNVSNAAAIALHKFYTSSIKLGLVP